MTFEESYIALRKKEHRVHDDGTVSKLPDIDRAHPLYHEWQIRKLSMQRLQKYIGKKSDLQILEIGCGNGWLSNKLSGINGSQVTGTDINLTELEQAQRVFSKNQKVEFLAADLLLKTKKFDLILLAGAIQYFENIETTIGSLLNDLNPEGEIHIIDSPFYTKEEQAAAKERTKKYYSDLGFSEMSAYYFHHTPGPLSSFDPEFLYRPNQITASIKKLTGTPYSPFPWIRIKKN